ncbi:MAG: hypothetical protein Q8K75_06770 [Chlamydiales bacterium]|nr:hypothetical protein [Chlamydiales bacterium]
MYKRHIVVTSFLLIALGVFAICTLLKPSESDQRALEEMIGVADEGEVSLRTLRQSRHQIRRDVLDGSPNRLRTSILSSDADLFVDYGQSNAVERLSNPHGFIQEELSFDSAGQPQQVLRWFEAESGFYMHHEHTIIADEISVARYLAPGHEIPREIGAAQPLLQGTAHHARATLLPTLQLEASDVHGAAATTSIRSQHASFDGKNLSLFGEVIITTPHAVIRSGEFHLAGQEKSAEAPFRQAMATGGIVIAFADGSRLYADHATIDVISGLAEFSSQPDDFVQWLQAETGDSPQTELLCRRLSIFFAMGEERPLLKEMIAHDDVTIIQEGMWTAMGDVGTFKANPEGKALTAGFVTLLSLQENTPCTIDLASGASLQAHQLSFDTSSRIVTLNKAIIEHPDWGRLENGGAATVFLAQNGKELELSRIEADGNTFFQGKARTLTSYGPIVVNHALHTAVFTSPRHKKRVKQVVFTDAAAEMRADELVIDYQPAQSQVDIAKVEAAGNVCLKGSLSGADEIGVAQQYALCDKLEYWPAEQRIVLAAHEGKVAILDKANGVAVSAPAIEVRRDPERHKDIIKGLGDVRFSLLERDYQLFKERFNLDVELPQ